MSTTLGTVRDTPVDPAYFALALQRHTYAVNKMSHEDARASINAAIKCIEEEAETALLVFGSDTRLIVLPEFNLTGYNMGMPIPAWTELAAISRGGPEYDALSAIAQRLSIFLAGHAYESDVNFPGLYFATTWLIDPSGEIVLRYRRLHSGVTPSPYDVWDAYLDAYGIDGVFPVARTDIGRIAVIPCGEIMIPELSRTFALRGAEVLLHPTSEVASPELTPHAIARRARAIENSMYVVSANSAGVSGNGLSPDSANGGSEVINYRGHVLGKAGTGDSVIAIGEIDLGASRRARRRAGVFSDNYLSNTKPQLWAEEYGRHDVVRPNGFDLANTDYAFFIRQQRNVIERLQKDGVV